MRILITGGAGFIGSHLCDYLLNQGHEVICLDNLCTGHMYHIKHNLHNRKFRFIKHDIINPLYLNGKIDQIYHLASRASPVDYQKYPIHTALTNSLGTDNLVKLSMKKDAIILFGSTSEAYGKPLISPQSEDYWGNVNPVGVRSCYDESKRFGETLLMAYHRSRNAKVKIVRIFNTYGPRLRPGDGRVMSNFILQCLNNDSITIYGTGKQTRSFCYITDTVYGLVKMMNSDQIGPKNLGNPEEITVLDLAQKIKKATKSKSKFVFKELPEDDPAKRKPDISSAKQVLGWRPVVKLDSGLYLTIEWFKYLLANKPEEYEKLHREKPT